MLSTQQNISYIDPTKNPTEQTCTSATVVTESDTTWDDDNNDGWYVVNGNVTISSRVTVTGEVHLILEDGCTLNASQGINVGGKQSLTIYGQSENEEKMGKLTATCTTSEPDGDAGIGGNRNEVNFGTITINGGAVTAKGGNRAAGIGGGGLSNNQALTNGNIIINGGSVTAIGGVYAAGIGAGPDGSNDSSVTITINDGTVYAEGDSGAGIGSGWDYVGEIKINIHGGMVTAKGGSIGAGIGGGYNGGGGSITITGGTITATGGQRAAGIGGGEYGTGGTIIISGGHVTANGSQGNQHYYSAGIGGGFQGAGGSITINGGVVNAHGGWTGIGSGEDGFGGTATGDCAVTVNGGVVTATGEHDAGIGGTFSTGEDGHAVIIADGKDDNEISDDGNTTGWSGLIITKTQGEGKIYGSDSFEIVNDLEIPEGYTLTIENGETLTIPTGVTLNNNGTIICNGTINGTVGGDVRYPSAVTVSVNQGDQSVTSVAYGSTITITATMTKQIATNALTAAVRTVDFWLGEVDTGTKLGPANVTGSGSTYTATLEVTLNDATKWIPSNSPYTITADFGGVAGTSGDGLISSAGSATLTVTKGSQTAPDAPTMSSRTTTSVTLNTINGGQGTGQYGYNTDGDTSDYHWQESTEFSGLQPGTAYTFYARYAENDYYNESPVSGGTSVTTLPEITTKNLDAGYVGVSYNTTLQASADGSKTVTWALASGSTLPDGLTLSNGTISGMPTKAVTDYTFTVQATINGEGDTQVTNSKELSITINAGTSVISITDGSGTYTYGDTITISGNITASSQAPSNGINSIAEPEQNQVGLYLGDTQLATANVTNGSFTITYDTAGQSIPIGNNQTLTVRYGGSSDLTSGSATVSITLNPKSVTAQVQGEITKVYDGNTDAAVNLAVASGDLVNDDDEITVTGTGTYSSADAGESIGVTVSNIQTDGDDSAWYTVSAPTGVTGAITKATQAAPNAPTVIERTSSSVTLAALGMTGQGALEYGYTTGVEGEPDNWQTGTTFTGLTSGTTYTFYARYAGNNNYNPAVSATGTETFTLSNTDPNVVNPGETVITDDGTKVTNDGEKITITPGDDGPVTVVTPDDGVTVNGDGTVNVPDGSTVQTGDGPEMTLPGGGTVDPDTGAVTPDEGGSVVIGSGEDTTTITPPSGQPVTPNEDGTITVPDGSTVQTGDGPEMTLPEGGTIDPDTGAVTPDEGGSVVIGSG
ncbi:beta strand repeat-containing protein, partial [Evtepia sp.]|uniref:beta strand repeat-containing protein n=1 Tax=Evtepia sp. TaxID=2773933 RepID=UPI002E76EBEE